MAIDTRPFNPHLTLFKLSKARDLHRKGLKKIDESWSSNYTDYHFGIENFQSLHLCNMLKKQTDGYYEIFHELNLCKFIFRFLFFVLSSIEYLK
jgi:2'-5' RNA ligase